MAMLKQMRKNVEKMIRKDPVEAVISRRVPVSQKGGGVGKIEITLPPQKIRIFGIRQGATSIAEPQAVGTIRPFGFLAMYNADIEAGDEFEAHYRRFRVVYVSLDTFRGQVVSVSGGCEEVAG